MRTDAYAVLVDFGSTYTKVVVADLRQGDIVLTWREPSTVATDATVALTRCFAKCRDTIGGAAFEAARKLASSSAAGGLRMGVVGLSRSLSTTAGRNAAFGAGAKILGTFCGHLTKEDVAALSSLPLEIVLFCGGYDGGGVRTLRHNAEMLASSRLHIPFVYAGNTAAAADVLCRAVFCCDRLIAVMDRPAAIHAGDAVTHVIAVAAFARADIPAVGQRVAERQGITVLQIVAGHG